MKQYITKHGQNIYDISLVLYGSIEGIFDLLVHNDSINLNNAIPSGTVLEYDETFIVNPQVKQWLEDNNTNVANKDTGIDYSYIYGKQLRIIIDQLGATSVIGVTLSSGTMAIDWGDGSAADIIAGTADVVFDHPYQDDGRHIIRIYGDFQLRNLDFREVGGIYYAVTRCRVSGSFQESTNRSDLRTLFV